MKTFYKFLDIPPILLLIFLTLKFKEFYKFVSQHYLMTFLSFFSKSQYLIKIIRFPYEFIIRYLLYLLSDLNFNNYLNLLFGLNKICFFMISTIRASKNVPKSNQMHQKCKNHWRKITCGMHDQKRLFWNYTN